MSRIVRVILNILSDTKNLDYCKERECKFLSDCDTTDRFCRDYIEHAIGKEGYECRL